MKTGVENYIFSSEIESGCEEPSGTSQPRIVRSTPGYICSQIFMIIDRSIHDESHTPLIIYKIGRKILFCLYQM